MSDDVWTTFTIGGGLDRSKLEELDAFAEGMTGTGDFVGDAVKSKTSFVVSGHRRCGNHDELEAWLRENDLTYTKHWCAGYEFSAGTEFWKPGMERPIQLNADEEGELAYGLRDLRAALAQGRTLAAIVAELEAIENIPPLTEAGLLAGVEPL